MADLVKSEQINTIAAKRSKKGQRTEKVNITPVEVESNAVGATGMVEAAILVADAELKAAETAYNARITENYGRFFQMVRQTGAGAHDAVAAQLKEQFGVTEKDLYGADD